AAQRIDLDARLADHDPGAGRVDVDRDPLLVLADQDVGEPGMPELAVDVLADLEILEQGALELLGRRVPVRLPVMDDSDAEAPRVDLLAHYLSASLRARLGRPLAGLAGFFVACSFGLSA